MDKKNPINHNPSNILLSDKNNNEIHVYEYLIGEIY